MNILDEILSGVSLASSDYRQLFVDMFESRLSEIQVAGILVAIRAKGETGQILEAAARVMREKAVSLAPLPLDPLVDNCGTGGDGSDSFNISTAAALVASSAGVAMAKHGNRSVSSRCGSADLLFACGYPDDLQPNQLIELLQQTNFAFFFAPKFHPGMGKLMPVRKGLGVRTIFNLLGPLANPMAPHVQLIGLPAKKFLRPMAEALHGLGIRRALLVHSEDGLDEISPAAPTFAVEVSAHGIQESVICPKDFGVTGNLRDLTGGDPLHNKGLLETLLDCKASPTLNDAVALNAGAVLWLTGKTADLGSGLFHARDLLAQGHVKRHFGHILKTAQRIRDHGNDSRRDT